MKQNMLLMPGQTGNAQAMHYKNLATVYAFLAAEASQTHRSTGDKILGVATILGVSSAGWALIVLLLSHISQ